MVSWLLLVVITLVGFTVGCAVGYLAGLRHQRTRVPPQATARRAPIVTRGVMPPDHKV